MLLSQIASSNREKYLNTTVQIKSAVHQGQAVLTSTHGRNQAVVSLSSPEKISSRCKHPLRILILNTDHIII